MPTKGSERDGSGEQRDLSQADKKFLGLCKCIDLRCNVKYEETRQQLLERVELIHELGKMVDEQREQEEDLAPVAKEMTYLNQQKKELEDLYAAANYRNQVVLKAQRAEQSNLTRQLEKQVRIFLG